MDELIKEEINAITQITQINDAYTSQDNNSIFLMNENSCGVCINCDLRSNCVLQEENKIFCEHYL
jgi:hypothetical protein